MATVHHRDPATGEWVALDISLSPSGAPGATGPTGPTRVSAAPGNIATVDSSGIYVPTVETQAATDLLYVQAAGATMTGALLLPDQIATPPSTPTVAAAIGYVDQLITVSDVEPTGITPSRDGLFWHVIEQI